MIETSITECCKANIPSQCRFEQSVWCHEARYMLANYTKLQAITLYKLASKVCYFNWISVESTRMKQIYLERQEKRNYKAKMESIRTCVTKDMMVLKIDYTRVFEACRRSASTQGIFGNRKIARRVPQLFDDTPKYDFARLALTNSKRACILYVHKQTFAKFVASRVVLCYFVRIASINTYKRTKNGKYTLQQLPRMLSIAKE